MKKNEWGDLMQVGRKVLVAMAIAASATHVLGQTSGERVPSLALGAIESTARYQNLRENGGAPPTWAGRFVVRIDGPSTSPNRYSVFSKDGRMLGEHEVSIPNASKISISHAVASLDAGVVFSGHAFMTDGTEQYFIARADPDGTIAQRVATSPFAPICICAARGAVWAFGDELNRDTAEGHSLLRKFEFGEEAPVLEALPSDGFQSEKRPTRLVSRWVIGPRWATWLRCDASRAYLYLDRSAEYIEVNATSGDVSRWRVTSEDEGMDVVGFAVTDSGGVFGSLVRGSEPLGLFTLVKNGSDMSVRWVKVDESRTKGTEWLWGADENSLVLWTHTPFDDPSGVTLQWRSPGLTLQPEQ